MERAVNVPILAGPQVPRCHGCRCTPQKPCLIQEDSGVTHPCAWVPKFLPQDPDICTACIVRAAVLYGQRTGRIPMEVQS